MPEPLNLVDPDAEEFGAPEIAQSNLTLLPPPPVRTDPIVPEHEQLRGLPKFGQSILELRQKRIDKLKDPGTPLDIDTGVSFKDRAALGLRPSFQDQESYLEGEYGPGNYRYVNGHWIVRKMDEKMRQPVDFLVDPERIEPGDIADLPSFVLDVATAAASFTAARMPAIVGAKIAKWAGLKGIVRDIASQEVGVALHGAARDIAIRTYQGDPWDLPEIGRRRTREAAIGALIGAPLVGGQHFLQWAKSPFSSSMSKVEFDLASARTYFKEKYGWEGSFTAGAVTGYAPIVRREKRAGMFPLASGYLKNAKQEQTTAVEQLQDIFIGAERSESSELAESLAEKLSTGIDPYRMAVEAAEQAVKAAKDEAVEQAESQVARGVAISESAARSEVRNINQAIAARTTPEVHTDKTFVGSITHNKINADLALKRSSNNALYNEFRAAGGDDIMLPMQTAAAEAKTVYDNLPRSLLDRADAAEALEASGKVATSFVPEKEVVTRLREIMAGGERRFGELHQMRTQVRESLANRSAMADTGAFYQNKIEDILTNAMDTGMEGLEAGRLKELFDAASADYKKNIVPYKQKSVASLLYPDESGKWVGPAQLAESLVGGGAAKDRYFVLRDMLGAESIEFRTIKRSVVDEILKPSLLSGEELVRGKAFAEKFKLWVHDSPEVARDILGSDLSSIKARVSYLGSLGDTPVPVRTVDDILKGSVNSIVAIKELDLAQKALDEAVRGKVLKSFEKGVLPKDLTPEDLLNRFFDKSQKDEARRVMDMIADDPRLTTHLRAGYMYNLMKEQGDFSIIKLMENKQQAAKAREIFGDDMMADLAQFANIERATKKYAGVGEMSGAFASGSVMGGLRSNPLGAITSTGEEYFAALALANPKIRKNIFLGKPSEPGLALTLFGNIEFAQGLFDLVGAAGASNIAHEYVRGTVDWIGDLVNREEGEELQRQKFQDSVRQRIRPLNLVDPDAQ